jgi:poly(A) polymerase
VLPKTYSEKEHAIDPRLIDHDALDVVRRLQAAGHTTYIVGGGVRDLLIKTKPKDFDLSTAARPEEIKRLFGRQCLLIGKRFRLAHIRYGKKIFEVSTFRSGDNEEGLIVRDNQWGSEEEDVLRRDFTINGLFYDPVSNTVIDYVGGWEDIQQKLLKTIGNPNIRFRQDPVRMIRLLKFRARLGFDVDPQARNALIECRKEIIKSAPARILEEIFRMLESGFSAHFMHLMLQSGLLKLIFPKLSFYLETHPNDHVFELLSVADALNQSSQNGKMDRAVLASCLLCPILEQKIQADEEKRGKKCQIGDVIFLANGLIKEVVMTSFAHFPKKITAVISYILSTQSRLHVTLGKQHFRLKILHNHDFVHALKLFQIRAIANKDLFDEYNHWQTLYQNTVSKKKQHNPIRTRG